jgi:transmembrane sensor
VRVVGTRFDVRHRGDQLSVTVERGVVEVRPNGDAPGRVWRLHPGQKLDHAEGDPGVQVSAVDPAQAQSWTRGRLIYRDQALGDVVADLNQQFPRQILIEDPELARTKVSGVLVLDNQEAVIRRLALLAPIKALPSADGIVLRGDPAAKP